MKYMGSKSRIAKEILSIVLKNRPANQHYVEPFLGGCNAMDKVSGDRIGSDFNYYIIEMWKALIYANWIPPKIDRDLYSQVRDAKESYDPFLVGWIGVGCSYSGKWFGGYAGETKTKIGTVRDYQDESIRNVLNQVKSLWGVKLENKDFTKLYIPKNSVVYCDPPYLGTTDYSSGGFSFNHELFWEWVRDRHSEGHTMYVSEYTAPDDFECVWERKVSSSLSANGIAGGNKHSIEKLFTLLK